MTFYINDVTLTNANFIKRTSTDNWSMLQRASDNRPYVEQTGQSGTSVSLPFTLNKPTRYTDLTSIKNTVRDCNKIFVRSSDKYLYGASREIWLAQTQLTVDESGNLQLEDELTGIIDPYQIHTCDFLTAWTVDGSGSSISASTDCHEGKAAIRAYGPTAGTLYNVSYLPTQPVNLSAAKYMNFWLKSSLPTGGFTEFYLQIRTTVGSDRLDYNLTYPFVNRWLHMDIDLSTPTSTSGTTDLSNINYIRITFKPNTTAAILFWDDIRWA
jgi:hypothetical protein